MNETFKVAFVQTDIYWEKPSENILNLQKLLEALPSPANLVVFPEMFTTGFLSNPVELAEFIDGKSVTWMKNVAGMMNLYLAGSLIIREDNNYYNRFILACPDGTIQYYNKRHLFTINSEESLYKQGYERKIFKIGKWRICPQICYDLRFPVWSRNRNDYDLLIYSANWPEARQDVWRTLLKARAIENLSYCIGVNRIGKDGNGISYIGESMALDYKGKVLNDVIHGFNGIKIVELSLTELHKFRNNFPVYKDADNFKIMRLS